MAEESTTPDLVELSYRRIEAVNSRDLEAVVSFFAAGAVWDMSPIEMGIFEGRAAIRVVLKTWWDTFPEIVSELDDVLDLGNGVVFQAVTQRGPPGWQYRRNAPALCACLRYGRWPYRGSHVLHRHRRGSCCRRTPRPGARVGDVAEREIG